MSAALEGRVPDVLETLAQLPNDEVYTHPKVVTAMLDSLPSDVWSKHDWKWLDPATKSGAFLREIYRRLMTGLYSWEPDAKTRREHILRNMIYGSSITEITGEVARRTLYQTRDATGQSVRDESLRDLIVDFQSREGNVRFVSAEHKFGGSGQNRRCTICRAPEALVRLQRENFAYAFIHGMYPPEEISEMKFDVIVGNPPYQIGTEGHGATASTIYNFFVERAIALDPRYVVMITPSRWFAGGKGLDEFRSRMIADRHLKTIVDNPKLFDVFPGVEIKGGVSWFVWDREHDGDCEFSTRIKGVVTSTAIRDLRAGDGIVLRDNEAAKIVDKVRAVGLPSIESMVSVTKPFGLTMRSNYKGSVSEPFDGAVPLIYGNKIGYSRLDQIQRNHEWINRWKVLLPRAGDGHGRDQSYVIGEPIALAPGSACTQTYFIAGMFETREETENYAKYLSSKFARFLILQRKITQDVTQERFRFVPLVDFNREWTDADLYERFGLSDDEMYYVENTILDRDWIDSLDSSIPTTHQPGGKKYGSVGDLDVVEEDD
jgi:site-specific DNA-methyltransferase (adenine-specific)